MSESQIVRAWKDAHYRNGLSDRERSLLPSHPCGLVELDGAAGAAAAGGARSGTYLGCGTSWEIYSFGCCFEP